MVWQTLLWSIGAAAFTIIMVAVFAGLRLRLSVCDAPKACQGLPIELVTVGILALALLSPTGAFAG
jgi:electron transport complex protein RnfA